MKILIRQMAHTLMIFHCSPDIRLFCFPEIKLHLEVKHLNFRNYKIQIIAKPVVYLFVVPMLYTSAGRLHNNDESFKVSQTSIET